MGETASADTAMATEVAKQIAETLAKTLPDLIAAAVAKAMAKAGAAAYAPEGGIVRRLLTLCGVVIPSAAPPPMAFSNPPVPAARAASPKATDRV